MDYEFSQDITGHVTARFSMDHEAIGQWLNEEIKGDISVIDDIENALENIKGSQREWTLIGHEYTLVMDDEEIMVKANQLTFITDELEEGMSYYDNESVAFCGVIDFIDMLNDYREFISQYKKL